jgi:pimeloyl-ACP methyl ester carboxylesterase
VLGKTLVALWAVLTFVPASARADYASVNGLKMYYEIQGAGRPLVLLYVKVAPDPKQWPALVAKVVAMLPSAKGFAPEDVRSIQAPTLIMIGDADIVRPEHAVEMFRLHQHARLAVLPGASHFTPMQRPDWIVSMTRAFFNASMPEAKK